jgi:LysM domain
MASLSAHLRQPGDHGRLAFHPECPVCRRERLVGTLSREPLVSRRAQALLSAGVLAIATGTPTAALAARPDQEREGTAVPGQVGDPASNPDFDAGGESTDLPFDVGTPEIPSSPGPDDDDGTAPVEQESATIEDAPALDPGDPSGNQGPSEQQAPPPAALGAEPPAPPVGLRPSAPATPDPVPADVMADPQPRPRKSTQQREPRTPKTRPAPIVRATPAPQPDPVSAPSETGEPSTVYLTQDPAPTPIAARSDGRAARPGDRVHVVLPGESLWSIADDLLGDGASVARVARKVNRLWELNSERIATGDRDLLHVGTRLVLR